MKKFFNIFLVLIVFALSNNTSAQKRSGRISSGTKIMISSQFGLALPMGDFSNIAGMGFGGSGAFIYNINSEFSITAGFSYYVFGKKKSDASFGTSMENSCTSYPISAGIRYMLGKGNFSTYIGAELGFYTVSNSWNTTFDNPYSSDYSFAMPGSSVSTKMGFAPLAGFYYKLNSSLELDVTAKFNYIPGDGGSTSYVNLNFGIAFGL